jgi:hypothetical protein
MSKRSKPPQLRAARQSSVEQMVAMWEEREVTAKLEPDLIAMFREFLAFLSVPLEPEPKRAA